MALGLRGALAVMDSHQSANPVTPSLSYARGIGMRACEERQLTCFNNFVDSRPFNRKYLDTHWLLYEGLVDAM